MMRRPALIVSLLICYQLFLAFVVANGEEHIINDETARLRVSIRKDSLQGISSCQHSFSQLELQNLDSSETITIHSIQTTSEETILVRSSVEGGKTALPAVRTWDDDTVPQQLHISRLPSGSLSLGPGQVAIVPVTFLPRYPETTHLLDDEHDSLDDDQPPRLSTTARADLLQLVGEDILVQTEQMSSENVRRLHKRNNLDAFDEFEGGEYQVKTTVMVDTSRGVVKMPITASSVRENPYGLPDSIKFLRPITSKEKKPGSLYPRLRYGATGPPKMWQESYGEIGSSKIVLIDTIHELIGATAPGHLDNTEDKRDCFDLFLSNPNLDMELAVMEVVVSQPDSVSVEFDPKKLLLKPDIRVKYTKPSQVIRDWTDEGVMYLPPDSAGNYIVTVCSCPEGVQSDEEALEYLDDMMSLFGAEQSENSLGFLQIRTDVDTLFVKLDYIEQVGSSNKTLGEDHLAKSSDSVKTAAMSNSAILKADPDNLQFRVITSASPTVSASVRLLNKSPVPIKILRATVGLETPNEDNARLADMMGLKVSAVFKGESTEDSEDDETPDTFTSLLIPAASVVDDGLTLTCMVDPAFHSHEHDSFKFSGRVVVRGTVDTELKYKQWKGEMLKNPYRDSHLVLEIPFTISILNGRVEVVIERSSHPYPQIWSAQPWDRSGRAISSLFFPVRDFQAIRQLRGNSSSAGQQNALEISHDLRILSNMPIPVKLEGGVIYDGKDKSGFHLDRDSPCRRLKVNISEPFETSSHYPGFEVLGFLSLQYFFDQPGKGKDVYKGFPRSENGSYRPVTCFLNVRTSPDNFGAHRIPLVLFPALLDLSQPRSVSKLVDGSTGDYSPSSVSGLEMAGSSTVMGLDEVADRLSTTNGWPTFRSYLESVVDDRRAIKDDHFLLRSFLMSLCRRSHGADNFNLRPILLEAGAVEHSSVLRSPLFFTNHNPVPVTITIDIGEIEGMSISLGRDASRGRGDGNHFLDFLPGNALTGNLLVNGTNIFSGHPIAGLRQFLSSNQESLKFFSKFPFRDAISISEEAVTSQPYLKALYKWHSYIEFHSDPLPRRLRPGAVSRCAGATHPASYGSQAVTRKKASPGPFILSEDQSVSKALKVCWDASMDLGAHSDGTKIVLPPGGVARFDVRVRSPPQSFLKNDISQLFSTGLVLSTNYGEVMPVLTSFEALQGQLQISNPNSIMVERTMQLDGEVDVKQTNVIPVPLDLHWQSPITPNRSKQLFTLPPSTNGDIIHQNETSNQPQLSPESDEVSLFLRSSFTREVRLIEVDSCNPWFSIHLRDATGDLMVDPVAGIDVGVVKSAVDCGEIAATNPDQFPSFFQCALKWLSDRTMLQPRGCGLLPNVQDWKGDNAYVEAFGGSSMRKITAAIERAANVLHKIYNTDHFEADTSADYSNISDEDTDIAMYSYLKSGAKRRDGIVSPAVLDIFAGAWDAWRKSSERGLHSISSNLRATIEYDNVSTGNEKSDDKNSLEISVQNIAVETVMSAPRLFDSKTTQSRQNDQEKSIPVLHFSSTPIGELTSRYVPLRNPTSVPIRVRIATAQYRDSPKNVGESKDDDDIVAEEALRKKFLMQYSAPYVQSGRNHDPPEKSAHNVWWDGHGAFYFKDGRGDIMRSHHNVTIRVGTGAHISMVNPSMHTNTAFLVGCGIRCGVRDDKSKGNDSGIDVRDSAPIGGSAAAGITLVGRKRSHLPQVNTMWSDEPYIPAAGFHLPGAHGPAPFAIPFSALDEIIIPPFESAQVGPVFFRPPGRYGALGCESLIESGANEWGIRVAEVCASKNFESVILLENSLTGLERIVLSGEGLLERLDFLDPPPDPGQDDFGNIELRNGRNTLLFPGSSDSLSSGDTVVREVLLHNSGDVEVFVTHLHLADVSETAMDQDMTKSRGACISGNFRLLNCWNSLESHDENVKASKNVGEGFYLSPGENKSFFLEHIPTCSNREEFVSLHVHFDGVDEKKSSKHGKSHVTLLVGHDMTDDEFESCISASHFSIGSSIIEEDEARAKSRKGKEHQSFSARLNRSILSIRTMTWKMVSIISTFLLSSLVFLGLAFLCLAQRNPPPFSDRLRLRTIVDKDSKENANFGFSGNAKAAFRCLARVDPSSIELNTLGREQIRQISLSRYKARGILAPQCFTNAGAFSRERLVMSSNKEGKAKDGVVAGNDRIRTLSDALFCNFPTPTVELKDGCLPVGMGWRVALSRGIINDAIIEKVCGDSLAVALLGERARKRGGQFTPQDESVISKSDESEATEDKTSDEESSETTSVDSSGKSAVTTDTEEPALTKEDNHLVNSMVEASTNGVPEQEFPLQEKSNDGGWIEAKKEISQKTTEKANEQPLRESEKKPSRANRKEKATAGKEKPNDVDPSVSKAVLPKAPKASLQTKQVTSSETTDKKAASKQATASEHQKGNKNSKKNNEKSARKGSKQEQGTSPEIQPKQKPEKQSKTKKSSASKKKKPKETIAPATPAEKVHDETSDSGQALPVVRPPPGLAPPPGFGQEFPVSAVGERSEESPRLLIRGDGDLGDMLTAALNQDAQLQQSSIQPMSFSRPDALVNEQLYSTQTNSSFAPSPIQDGSGTHPLSSIVQGGGGLSESHMSVLPSNQVDGRIEGQNEFDVMDFLDSILSDGGQGSDSLEEPAGLSLPNQGVAVTANPWASDGATGTSRASAYGISFDENDERPSTESQISPIFGTSASPSNASFQNIPLLTPAAILSAGYVEEEEDDAGNSFYAAILSAGRDHDDDEDE